MTTDKSSPDTCNGSRLTVEGEYLIPCKGCDDCQEQRYEERLRALAPDMKQLLAWIVDGYDKDGAVLQRDLRRARALLARLDGHD